MIRFVKICPGSLLAGMFLLRSFLGLGAEVKPEDIYATILPSTLTLETETAAGKRFIGSAFLAGAEGVAVTAWHVIHDAVRVEARFSDNERVDVAGIIDKDEKLDLALIRIESRNRSSLKLNTLPPRIGSRIYVVGAPRGFEFSLGDGLISQIRTLNGVRYYQVSCPISPGDSGGPVLNDRGEVIGVMSWRKADAENVGFALPSSDIELMNPHLDTKPWQDSSQYTSSPFMKVGTTPFVRADSSMPSSVTSLSNQKFEAFCSFLASQAGKEVTVTVKEGAKENTFSFEVPATR